MNISSLTIQLLATVNEWNSIFDINALGTMLCFKYAAKQMIRQGSGGRLIGDSTTSSYFHGLS